MINREEAQKQLQELRVKNWKTTRIEQMKGLPTTLAEIGFSLLGCDSQGKPIDTIRQYQHNNKNIEKFEALNSTERLEIFRILFPEFWQLVEQAWQLLTQLPYQIGYQRKAFRLPNNPEFFCDRRYQWLMQLLQVVEGYEQPLAWFAAWTPYLGYYGADTLGILFAAAINENNERGQEIFDILIASANGEHEIGAMGRHVTRGLLVSSNAKGWEFIEKMLLAAQRQEGLRQVILETIDEAHPEAFKRMIRLILEHNLTRFSAVVRGVDVWLGLGWESSNQKLIKQILEQISLFLEDSEARINGFNSDDPQRLYCALWTLGFEDAMSAIPYAETCLNNPNPEIRFVAVYFLFQLGFKQSKIALFPALEDTDLRVVTQALLSIYSHHEKDIKNSDLFERLESILSHFPEKEKELPPIVWDWIKLKVSQRTVAGALVNNLGERTPKSLIPYLSLCEPYTRANIAEKLAKIQPWDQEIRETLFSLIGDSSQWVREKVIQQLSKVKITPEEAIYLETLLNRKSGDLRRGILTLLLNQDDTESIVAAERLLKSKKLLQRQAGLELLQEMIQQKRQIETCRHYAKTYQETHQTLSEAELNRLKLILAQETEEPSLENGLGLVNLEELNPITSPKLKQTPVLVSAKTMGYLVSLDQLIHEHRQIPIIVENYQGKQEELLGNVNWNFPNPNSEVPLEKDLERLPLRDLWENWYQQLNEQDNLELVRAIAIQFNHQLYLNQNHFNLSDPLSQLQTVLNSLENQVNELSQLKYPSIIKSILMWLIRLYPPDNLFDFLLDATVITINAIDWKKVKSNRNLLWTINDSLLGWVHLTESLRPYFISSWKESHQIRFWQIIQWITNSLEHLYYNHNYLGEIIATYHAGGVTKADITAYLILRKPIQSQDNSTTHSYYKYRHNFNDLSQITRRKHTELDLLLKEISHQIRQRILDIELNRGDLPTAASEPALALSSVEGIIPIIQLLQGLGKNTLVRGYTYDNLSKSAVFSHLIRVSFPAEADTPQQFAKEAKAAKISQERLIDLAFYAPQWSNYVEEALAWKSFTEAVWWIHAHTKDNNWQVPSEIRESWVAQVTERTPLSAESLVDGAVDVDWFKRIYQDLKGEKWQKIINAAKYASSSGGHKRSQLFAQAMLGEIEPQTLITRITEKRHQDTVRALGLLPLGKGTQREKDLLQRYQIIQEFIRTSRKFGSQRQASEKLAATIALENLSRTAGYRDPQRLEWAMEAQTVADLVEKPQTITLDDVNISLAITNGEPVITVEKQGKTLKSIPAKISKNADIIALKQRKQDITRQGSRMRVSLEEAMCRGDSFTPEELEKLCHHPVLSPMLTQLVFIGDEEIGYPVEGGKALQSFNGKNKIIKSSYLRIAHSHDLLTTQQWHLWQKDCFEKERKQPFKQVFRELYLLTPAEKATDTFSNRYEGHQVNPRQALALLGKRGWITCPEEGVRKTFHKEGISVWVSFLEGFYTPADVDGLTLEGVSFTPRGEWKPLKLQEIPPRLFSEVMRDLDLLVSVAHQGGVDPEASLSTVEMRSALVRETCRLLKLTNVQLQNSHVLIEGKLGSYSVHLGSAIVHRQPGGSLCIIPVHSQHRGRLFLPFADDDPKTAEVVSKVLLLAKDQEIKDPTILEQLLN